MESKKTS
ncbi:hypothetical protein ECPA5_4895, partial [Escherichia coli PA5]